MLSGTRISKLPPFSQTTSRLDANSNMTPTTTADHVITSNPKVTGLGKAKKSALRVIQAKSRRYIEEELREFIPDHLFYEARFHACQTQDVTLLAAIRYIEAKTSPHEVFSLDGKHDPPKKDRTKIWEKCQEIVPMRAFRAVGKTIFTRVKEKKTLGKLGIMMALSWYIAELNREDKAAAKASAREVKEKGKEKASASSMDTESCLSIMRDSNEAGSEESWLQSAQEEHDSILGIPHSTEDEKKEDEVGCWAQWTEKVGGRYDQGWQVDWSTV